MRRIASAGGINNLIHTYYDGTLMEYPKINFELNKRFTQKVVTVLLAKLKPLEFCLLFRLCF